MNLLFLNYNMDAFIFEDEWEFVGENAAPYFDLNIGFYQYLNVRNYNIINEINEMFDVGVVNGRWALIYRARKYREIE